MKDILQELKEIVGDRVSDSPGDLLLQYSKVYHVRIGDRTLISEVPKKVRDLDSKLGLSLFPTT